MYSSPCTVIAPQACRANDRDRLKALSLRQSGEGRSAHLSSFPAPLDPRQPLAPYVGLTDLSREIPQ